VTVEQITQKGCAHKLNGGVRHVPAAVKGLVFKESFGRAPGRSNAPRPPWGRASPPSGEKGAALREGAAAAVGPREGVSKNSLRHGHFFLFFGGRISYFWRNEWRADN
jgi:hypothetical protein